MFAKNGVSRTSRAARWCLQCRCTSTASTSPSAPPMLLKIRSDLKAAMKARDINRLSVLRGLLADTTNLAKTNNPVKTDLQVLALLRKRASAARSAADEFSAANRDDLKEKEEAQATVLEEYAGGIDTVDANELGKAVRETVERMKLEGVKIHMGSLRTRILGDGGALHGRPVEMKELVKIAQAVIEGTPKS